MAIQGAMPRSTLILRSAIIGPVLGLVLGLVSLAIAALTGGLSHSFIDPDESAHYVNTLFIADWLRAGMPSPMPFARDFYAHFPKLSIGHWPPGWYALMAPFFACFRPSPFEAAVISAWVAGLPALLVYGGLRRSGAKGLGLAASLYCLLLPVSIDAARYFLLDQPVALAVGLAALAWLWAVRRPGWAPYLAFGAAAALATLIKGNGALVVLIPAIEIALAGRWRLLRDYRLWIAGAITLAIVVPWYLISFRIAAGGFNYAPGPAYAWASLATNTLAVIANIGWAGLALAIIGGASGLRDRRMQPVARIAIAVIAATLIFQAIVPVALVDRYILPLLPWLVILVAIGLQALWRVRRAGRVVAALLLLGACLPAISGLRGLTPKPDLGAPAIAAQMIAAPGIWMVDGRAGGEGAMIAAAAYADRGRRALWVARASQWLSTSDFMGNGYRLAATTPGGVAAIVDRLGARGIVLIAERRKFAYPHSRLLRRIMIVPAYSANDRAFAIGDGIVRVANRRRLLVPRVDLLAGGSGSRNFSALSNR